MEFNAKVYAMVNDEELLHEIHDMLKAKSFQGYLFDETMKPCAVFLRSEKLWQFVYQEENDVGFFKLRGAKSYG